jgi:hypothetical protein
LLHRLVIPLAVVPALALSACGSSHVDTAKYTCAQFNKSLKTKGDDSAGTFIRDLRTQAKLGQAQKTERSEITLGIYSACFGKPGSTTPGPRAIVIAKQVKTGKFKLPAQPKKKKSN